MGLDSKAILKQIDNIYLNTNTNETIVFGDKFKENNFLFSSLLNNIFNSPFIFETDNYVLFKNVTDNSSIEIINNIQELFKRNLLIPVNIRKNLNISENTIGFYSRDYLVSKDETNFLSNIKNIKNILEFPSISIIDLLPNDFIRINSFLKYKLPSFCVQQIPNDSHYGVYNVFVTPKNNEGISGIYMNKKLYNFYKENINKENV